MKFICSFAVGVILANRVVTADFVIFANLTPLSYDGTNNVVLNGIELGIAGSAFGRNESGPAAAVLPVGLPTTAEVIQDLFLMLDIGRSEFTNNQLLSYWAQLHYFDQVFYSNDTAGQVAGTPLNEATAYYDLDFLYGRTADIAASLRELEGGRMKLTAEGLPLTVTDPTTGVTSWLLGDQRTAQNIQTLALHVILLREHNRRTTELTGDFLAEVQDAYGCNPTPCTQFNDEEIYQAARVWTQAFYQHIMLHEVVPHILGLPAALDPPGMAAVLDPTVDAFAAVALRWPWHSLGIVDRLIDENFMSQPTHDPTLTAQLGCTYTDIAAVLEVYGVDSVVRGAAAAIGGSTRARAPVASGSACLMDPLETIQMGRDFKLPSYNEARLQYGLPAVTAFSEITSNATAVALLTNMYGTVENVEAVVGGMLEEPVGTSIFGQLYNASLYMHYRKMKHADEHWHLHNNVFTDVRYSGTAELLRRNSDPAGAFQNASGSGLLNVPTAIYSTIQLSLAAVEGQDTPSVTNLVPSVYTVWWFIDQNSDSISFHFDFEGMGDNGYFAFGIGSRMIGADIIFVSFEDGVPTVSDRFGTGNSLPVYDTALSGGVESTELIASQVIPTSSGNSVSIEVNRKLSASDAYDTAITQGSLGAIFSFNKDYNSVQHNFDDKGVLTIDFYAGSSTPPVNPGSETKFFATHGIIMIWAWGICAPIAFVVARYKKHWDHWIEIHEFFAAFATEATIPIAIATIAATAGVFATKHGKIGLSIFVIVMIQYMSGQMRVSGLADKGVKHLGDNYDYLHRFNKTFHKWNGRGLVALGLMNIYLGSALIAGAGSGSSLTVNLVSDNGSATLGIKVPVFAYFRDYIYYVIIGILILYSSYCELMMYLDKKKYRKSTKKVVKELPMFTMVDFNDRVLQGDKLVIAGDAVIDVSEYIHVHPGGSKLIRESIGTDVTKELMGATVIRQGQEMKYHKHGVVAWRVLHSNAIAYIERTRKGDGPGDDAESTAPGGMSGRQIMPRNRSQMSSSRLEELELEYVKFMLVSKTLISGEMERPVVALLFKPCGPEEDLSQLRQACYHRFRALNGDLVIQRSYTPVARPLLPDGTEGYLYYVRLHAPGRGLMSDVLRDLKVGASVRAQGPFCFHHAEVVPKKVFMLCSGTGITPMLQAAIWYTSAAHKRLVEETTDHTHDSPDTVTVLPEFPEMCTVLWRIASAADCFALSDLHKLSRQSDGLPTEEDGSGSAYAAVGLPLPMDFDYHVYMKKMDWEKAAHFRRSSVWTVELPMQTGSAPLRWLWRFRQLRIWSIGKASATPTHAHNKSSRSVRSNSLGNSVRKPSTAVVGGGPLMHRPSQPGSQDNIVEVDANTTSTVATTSTTDSSVISPNDVVAAGVYTIPASTKPVGVHVQNGGSAAQLSHRTATTSADTAAPMMGDTTKNSRRQVDIKKKQQIEEARMNCSEGTITLSELTDHLAPLLDLLQQRGDKEVTRADALVIISGPIGFVAEMDKLLEVLGVPVSIVECLD